MSSGPTPDPQICSGLVRSLVGRDLGGDAGSADLGLSEQPDLANRQHVADATLARLLW